MKRVALGRAAAVVAAVGVTMTTLSAASPASADQIGTLTFNGLASQQAAFTVTTSSGCPTSPTNATNFQIRISNDLNVVGNSAPTVFANITGNTSGSTIGGGINAAAFTASASATLAQFASNNGLGPQLPGGTYLVQLICRTLASSMSLGEFAGRVVIGSGGTVDSAEPLVPVVDADTTTEVSTPATADWGADLVLTATVSNASNPSGDEPVGTVQFKDGGNPLGSPATLDGNGVATLSVNNLSLGAHSITADFAAGAGFKDSNDASAVTVTIGVGAPANSRVPALSGIVRVGGTAVCNTGTWTNATSYRYEFKTNGVTRQAASSDFDVVLGVGDLGKSLTCVVTGVNPDGQASSTTSGVTVVAGAAAVATVKPKIVYSGTPVVGKTFKASRGTWSPSASYRYYYVWKRGSVIVKQGTTATSYKASSLDKGKTIYLQVQARRTGYLTGVATSAGVRIR